MAEVNPAAEPAKSGVAYSITSQYIKDFSFENPHAPQVFAITAGATPQVQVSVTVSGQTLGEKLHEVTLEIRAKALHNDDIVFVAELAYSGVVVSSGGIPMEHLKPLLMIEVPRQLFPFARAILANATRDAGFPPLLLAPVDFEALHRQQDKEIDDELRKMRLGPSSAKAES